MLEGMASSSTEKAPAEKTLGEQAPAVSTSSRAEPADGIVIAGPESAQEIAALAAATFPLACPPSVTGADVQAFVDEVLSPARFTEYLADTDRTVLLARRGRTAVAYAMLVHTPPADPHIAQVLVPGPAPATEISKFYADSGAHGTGVAAALMDAVMQACADRGHTCAWLGVNQQNRRAQRFYRKHGFEEVGTKTFVVGADRHDDFVMARAL